MFGLALVRFVGIPFTRTIPDRSKCQGLMNGSANTVHADVDPCNSCESVFALSCPHDFKSGTPTGQP